MGLDLTLVVNAYRSDDNMPLAYERLRLDANYKMFDSIKDAGAVPLRANRELRWYGDEGIERRQDDPYGDRITSIRAKQVADAMSTHKLTDKNIAVFAYMKALPPDTEIFLWWH